MMMPTLTVATAHAFVLTVSHDLLFRQPPFTATTLLPPLPSNLTRFASSPDFQFHQISNFTFIVRRRAARCRPRDFRSRFQSRRHVLGKSRARENLTSISPPSFNMVRSARQFRAR
jgi:hypothetical protein